MDLSLVDCGIANVTNDMNLEVIHKCVIEGNSSFEVNLASSETENTSVGVSLVDSGSVQVIGEEILDDHDNVILSVSPGNTKYYQPICSPKLTPFVGQLFPSVAAAFTFYTTYSEKVGFKVRPGTELKSDDSSKTTIWKYLLCSKQGKSVKVDSKKKVKDNGKVKVKADRKTKTSRCSCIAKITLRFEGDLGYRVRMFEARHTHPLLLEDEKQFCTSHRKLTGYHHDFIINCLKSNIGTSSAHKLYKNTVGSYANVGASYIDFKNFSRDMNVYLSEYDAQMVIDNLSRRKERCSAYFFDYAINENKQLSMLFYSDPISRKSFSFFGDVVSADATYKSNRYGMVFVPFTGVDNHKCSITFGFGLLLNEDISSYIWLFENFKKAMGHEPFVILTDQDLAVKVAIEKVFSSSVHRFCMWHIMFKLPVKVKLDASILEDFMQRFNSIVWSDKLMPEDFDTQWHSILHDFKLETNAWLISLFDLRHYWVPAYFKEVNMGSLLRTTSRSKSQNFFFSSFIGSQSCLNVFIIQYDNAVEAQRHNQRKNDYESVTCFPTLETPFEIEKHCSSVFTVSKFFDVQQQIQFSLFCSLVDIVKVDPEVHFYHVRSTSSKLYIVRHVVASDDLGCSCNKFLGIGIPCSHLFLVLRSLGKDSLPIQLIKERWSKKAILQPTFVVDGSVFKESEELDEKKQLAYAILSETHSIRNAIDEDVILMKDFLQLLKEKKDVYLSSTDRIASTEAQKKQKRFESLLGPRPTDVEILPPPQAKTKGKPKKKRLKSGFEKGSSSATKEKRTCGKCFKSGHNSRTCKQNP